MNPYKTLLVKKTNCTNETKMAIQTAFLTLYKRKDFQRITVKELCAEIPIARTTFYSYYQNSSEVIEDIENCIITDLLYINSSFRDLDIVDDDSLDFFKDTLEYISTRQDVFLALLIKQPDVSFINKWKNCIKYNFYERYLRNKSNAINVELAMEMIASAALGSYIYWVGNTDNIETKEVNKLVLMMINSIESRE